VIARKTWKEIRGLTILYFVLIEIDMAISVYLWQWLRDEAPTIAQLVPADFIRRWVDGVTAADASVAYNSYVSLQVFFKGANIMGLVFALVFGAVLIARERENHTLEFLLSRPISRSRILFSKFWVAACALALPILVTSWSAIPLSWLVGEDLRLWEMTLASLYSGLFCVMFLAITTICSVRMRTQLNVIAAVGAVVVFELAIYFVQKIRLTSIFRLADYDVFAPILAGNLDAGGLLQTRGIWLLLATVMAYWLANRLLRKAEL